MINENRTQILRKHKNKKNNQTNKSSSNNNRTNYNNREEKKTENNKEYIYILTCENSIKIENSNYIN